MPVNRRDFLRTNAGALSIAVSSAAFMTQSAVAAPAKGVVPASVSGKKLGTIFNMDQDGMLGTLSAGPTSHEEYRRCVLALLDLKPRVLAQNVGNPDGLLYPSEVTNSFDKYIGTIAEYMSNPDYDRPRFQRLGVALKAIFQAGTDPLKLTIEACRQRGVLCLASYRMNAEDFYGGQTMLSDFERAHPEWKIPGRNCLDWAIPQVYEHRMNIFREVVEKYDIDGIEFDFRRHHHMVSDPAKNHVVLTQLVRETRALLDQAAQKKGRDKLILETRVCPSLNTDPSPYVYPGVMYGPRKPYDLSCKDLGLDLQTWVAEGLVDAICPSMFLQGLPKIREFVELTKGTSVGVYPTLFANISWESGLDLVDPNAPRSESLQGKSQELLALYKDDLCAHALRIYADGADGISLFNWGSHMRNANMPNRIPDGDGLDGLVKAVDKEAIQTYLCPLLGDPAAIRHYREQLWPVPPKS